MIYEEAIGVGRVISPMQLSMVMHMGDLPPECRRDYNVDELLWKDLISPSTETVSGYTLTDRGEAVREARLLKETDDATLLRIFHRTDGESAFALRVLREIEDRWLDI